MSVLSKSGVCVPAVEACEGGSVPECCIGYSAAAGSADAGVGLPLVC